MYKVCVGIDVLVRDAPLHGGALEDASRSGTAGPLGSEIETFAHRSGHTSTSALTLPTRYG